MKLEKLKLEEKSISKESMSITFGGNVAANSVSGSNCSETNGSGSDCCSDLDDDK